MKKKKKKKFKCFEYERRTIDEKYEICARWEALLGSRISLSKEIGFQQSEPVLLLLGFCISSEMFVRAFKFQLDMFADAGAGDGAFVCAENGEAFGNFGVYLYLNAVFRLCKESHLSQ